MDSTVSTDGMEVKMLLEQLKKDCDLDRYVSNRLGIGHKAYTRQ